MTCNQFASQRSLILEPCSGFSFYSSQTQQTWCVESFSAFAIFKQWPSTQEHVFKLKPIQIQWCPFDGY